MFTFQSFPAKQASYKHIRHNAKEEEDFDMDDDDWQGNKVTTPGETVASFHAYMRGHGTYIDDDEVVSSVAGTVERVNKLISVRPISSRYNPEVGDLVVGRITEVQSRRWKVNVMSRQDALLALASVNLPGGVQRRKLESDELQMRTYFEEGDLLVAEVQQILGDGTCNLHTRSLRYGKLRNGMLVKVPPTLIRRLKSHFFSLACGVDIILGLNGFIWVSKHIQEHEQMGEEGFDAQAIYSNKNDDIDISTRKAISLTSALIEALARGSIPITDIILTLAYEWAVDNVQGDDLGRDLDGDDLVVAAMAWLNQ